ncbi:TPA: Flp family type IVb pilin [Citrobacter braakii]|jgi:pilus assembly protein Flp/PilA|nr:MULTISPECIES: hypothetical protein [Citrobacter]OCF82819.1 hypothetical protein AS299_21055 [Citrobacter freundii]MBJ8997147.1 Flp family type IVb pilin [Citrobacter braakii]MBS6004952.1 Flp family type IVb pilin [Citrobacter sp.]MDM3453743.1 Flp family type IVb pilin [Citrobacter sp. Cb028]MDW2597162.1 Flp family type IVb pilin [Citrobacter braakii]
MLNNMIIKAYTAAHIHMAHKVNHLVGEKGITAIEYAIIGVAMASGLFYIFDEGGFLASLEAAWKTMSTKITGAGNILNK